MIDGYSSIKSLNENKLKNHDYASIKETKINKNLNNNDDDEGSDIYSSIPNSVIQIPHVLNYNDIDITNQQDLILAGNSPGYSSISETRTTPSTDSNSSDVQMGYSSINKNNSSSTTTTKTSNYESLTESESDPNYESVKYTNIKENPYERLHNEKSPVDPSLPSSSSSSNQLNDLNIIEQDQVMKLTSKVQQPSATNKTSNDNLEVGDYFQVWYYKIILEKI